MDPARSVWQGPGMTGREMQAGKRAACSGTHRSFPQRLAIVPSTKVRSVRNCLEILNFITASSASEAPTVLYGKQSRQKMAAHIL